MRLATGPVSWGVDFADAAGNPPWEHVLDEIERSGVGALELGPVGYLPEHPPTLRAALESRNLTAVGSFVFDDFHDPARRDAIAAVTIRACRAIAVAGGTLLVLIDRPSPERAASAGRSDAAPRLGPWRAMIDQIVSAAAIAREHGLRPVFHPHAGSYVEFEDEIDRLLADSDLDLCLDSGHLAYGGIAPERALRAYASRLGHVHLKDARADVLERGLGFWEVVGAGVFCPLGEGVVDVAAVVEALDGYDGFATIEQDRLPGSGSPLEELARSVEVVRAAAVGGTA
jgi:inosose dehydratase